MMTAKGKNKMKPLFFFIPLFIILVIEGIAIDFLPQFLAKANLLATPHWIFMFLLLMTFKFDTNDTYYAVIYGAVFGMLVDIVYSDVLGIYLFIYPFVIYLVHISKRFLQTNFYMLLIIASVSLLIVEILLFFVYFFVLFLVFCLLYFLFILFFFFFFVYFLFFLFFF